MPRFSVIIPCYNQGRFVDEAVDSVLAQTFQDFEILIVDDGSTDPDTVRKLGQYDKPKTRVIRTENQGLSAARNNGVREARGDLILPLDADDRIAPTYLQEAAAILDGEPDVGIVYCQAEFFGGCTGLWDLPAYSLPRMLLDNLIFCAAAFRRSDWERVGGYVAGFRTGWEDYDFWLSLIESGRQVVRIPEVLFFYRRARGSMDDRLTPEDRAKLHARIFRRHEKFYTENAAALFREIGRQKASAESAETELARAYEWREEVERSLSWRITRPLRWVHFLIQLLTLRASIGGAFVLLRHLRFRSVVLLLVQRFARNVAYRRWVRRYDPPLVPAVGEVARRDADSSFARLPLISVVMPTFNSPGEFLRAAIESVLAQTYPRWELCIADDASTQAEVRKILEAYRARDPRVRVCYRPENGHISAASNSALDLAQGEFVALLDHDDVLRPHALAAVVRELNRHPDADLVYSDEDKIGRDGRRCDPYFKPDWNPDLFLSQNYLCHLTVIRRSLVEEVGRFRLGYEGSQDWDLFLRVTERTSGDRIRHIPRVLYHWRAIPGSAAFSPDAKRYTSDASLRALADHLRRRQIRADVLPDGQTRFRVRYPLPPDPPQVSVIIGTRDRVKMLRRCVESIRAQTTYRKYELIVMDNDSEQKATLTYLDELRGSGAKILPFHGSFNFSALNNAAARQASGEVLAFLNNDLEVITPGWLDEMVSQALRPGIGAVGAKLFYPNDTVQHAGVILGIGGVAGHAFKHFPRTDEGQKSRANAVQNYTAVTAACLVIRRAAFREVGGFDEAHLGIAFNDVDFCIRLHQAGYRNLYTPHAQFYHHESASRGADDTPSKRRRFSGEARYMRDTWGPLLTADPAYNPNLTLAREDFSLAWPPRVDLDHGRA